MSWLDVGCGTGALSEAIFENYKPGYLCCVDPSADFLERAKQKDSFKATFLTGNASSLPLAGNAFNIVVSGLALNFFPDLPAALAEMKRVLKKNGVIAAYVWDYAGKMEFLRLFWDAAREVDVNATNLDEGNRFPICNADNLRKEFDQAGLTDIETTFLDIDTVFTNFEDYWNPFLGRQGPAPSYLASVDKDLRDKIKSVLHRKLYVDSNGPIKLFARAIAVRGNYRQ
jgi:SAM-dependent methyltransferase